MKLFNYEPTVNIATSRITVDDVEFTVAGENARGGELRTRHGVLTFMCFEGASGGSRWQLEVLAHDYPDVTYAQEAYYIGTDSEPKEKLAELLEDLRVEQDWRLR